MEDFKQTAKESKQLSGVIAKEYPDFFKGVGAFHDACMSSDALDGKTRELIAVALSVGKQCSACIVAHVVAALKAGATKDEIMGATFVAVLMGGGPAFMYAKEVRKALDDFGAA